MDFLFSLDIALTMGLVLGGAVLALGLAFRLLHFPDLTVEGSLPLGAAVYAALVRSDHPPVVAALAACAAGALAGALTGWVHVRFKVNKFLAGIIVIAISYSVSLRIMQGSNIGLLGRPSMFSWFESYDSIIPGLHFGTLGFLALLALAGGTAIVFVLQSKVGTRLRAVGSNPDFASSLGLNTHLYLVLGLAATNSISALSGVLLAMHQGFADIGLGQGVLILALAAMTIGERLLPSKRLSFHVYVVVASLLGSIVFQMIWTVAIRVGVPTSDLKLATAVLVLLVIALRMSSNGELYSESST